MIPFVHLHRDFTLSDDCPRIAILHKRGGLLTWCEDLVSAFDEAGVDCATFNLRPETIAERWDQFTAKTKLLNNAATCRRLATQLAAFSPDIVLVLSTPGLSKTADALLRAALRPGVPIIGWLCDQIGGLPKGQLPLLDGVYYFDSSCLPILQVAYEGTTVRFDYLPLAAAPTRYPYRPAPESQRKQRLAFAGNCTPSRQRIFAEYRRAGGSIELFGPHSGGWRRPWKNRKLSSAALATVYRENAVSLNLLQPENTQFGLNLRAFEIPCAGGLGTYPDVPDLARCFEPGREIIAYRSLDDLRDQVARLMNKPDERAAIVAAGHRRVLREHTFWHRATKILADWLPGNFYPQRPAYLDFEVADGFDPTPFQSVNPST